MKAQPTYLVSMDDEPWRLATHGEARAILRLVGGDGHRLPPFGKTLYIAPPNRHSLRIQKAMK